MAEVLGVGGVFLTSPDPDRLRTWYKDSLGLDIHTQHGTILPYAKAQERHGRGAMTVLSIWDEDTDYIKPSTRDAMINFIVDDLDDVLAKLKAQNIPQEGDTVTESYGKFAWILDPDGRKLELWQPMDPEAI